MIHLNHTEYRRVVYTITDPIPSIYPIYEDGDCNDIFDEWFRSLYTISGVRDNGQISIDTLLLVQMVQDENGAYHLQPYQHENITR
jgi:hypothetical protein